MVTKIDIFVQKIKAIIKWYEEITDGEYSISIEKAEELLQKLEEIK